MHEIERLDERLYLQEDENEPELYALIRKYLAIVDGDDESEETQGKIRTALHDRICLELARNGIPYGNRQEARWIARWLVQPKYHKHFPVAWVSRGQIYDTPPHWGNSERDAEKNESHVVPYLMPVRIEPIVPKDFMPLSLIDVTDEQIGLAKRAVWAFHIVSSTGQYALKNLDKAKGILLEWESAEITDRDVDMKPYLLKWMENS